MQLLRTIAAGVPLTVLCLVVLAAGVGGGRASRAQTAPAAGAESKAARVPLTFSGGYETDPRDRGRPVVLVAGALGVTPEVFREAFRRVRPAPAGTRPEPGQERQNKAVLMEALGRYGITNDRLDAVSNYYRYLPGRGMWPTRPATGYAVVERGAVTSYVVTDGGSGYCSPPTVAVPGYPNATPTVRLAYGPRFDRNGSVAAIEVR